MNRIHCSVLASLLLVSACSNDATKAPAAAPAKPAAESAAKPAAAPAQSAKPPMESAKPPAANTTPSESAKAAPESAKPPMESAKAPAETAKAPVETPKMPPNANMDAAIKDLMARPEQSVDKIEIQHCLIAFKGVPRVTGVTRTKEEAHALAEKVYVEAISGGDFLALVKQYTNDSAPGIYPLNQKSRKGMAKSFGDVGFRLQVGEIGVAGWDETASPFGWHIIKRLK